jgi:hypothetical protein
MLYSLSLPCSCQGFFPHIRASLLGITKSTAIGLISIISRKNIKVKHTGGAKAQNESYLKHSQKSLCHLSPGSPQETLKRISHKERFKQAPGRSAGKEVNLRQLYHLLRGRRGW